MSSGLREVENYNSYFDSDFHREWAGPLGMIDTVQGTLDKTASGIALLTCVRHRDTGITTEREIRRMRLVMPAFPALAPDQPDH